MTAKHERPSAGGSYVRDPKTGAIRPATANADADEPKKKEAQK